MVKRKPTSKNETISPGDLAIALRALGMLMKSGITILEAFECVAANSRNPKLRAAIMQIRAALRQGEGVAGPMKSTNVFPAACIQVVGAGEETGKLDEVLGKLADYMEAGIRLSQSSAELALVTRRIAILVSVGMAFIQCLTIVAEDASPKMREILLKIRNAISAGENIAESLAKHPQAFNSMYVTMVRAGETGGVLDANMDRLADQLEAEVRLANKRRR